VDPYRLQAELIKAMAHPARLHILEILAQEECCVCHLTTVLRKRQAYVLADPLVAEAIAVTRQLLVDVGREIEFPALPPSPVDGCPCPKCGDGVRSG